MCFPAGIDRLGSHNEDDALSARARDLHGPESSFDVVKVTAVECLLFAFEKLLLHEGNAIRPLTP